MVSTPNALNKVRNGPTSAVTKYMYKSDTIGKHPKDEEFIV